MSLIPAFKIGLWNAWIFVLYQLLPLPLFTLTALRKRGPANPDISILNQAEKKVLVISKIIMFFPMIYAIFLPLKLGTVWFYVGLPIALLGLVMYTVVWVYFAITPIEDLPLTEGLYHYSRHPMYLAALLTDIGVGIACASWLYLLLTVVSVILTVFYIPAEERLLLEQYGDTYRNYMNITPRWLGIPKSVGK
jgi:protein-S-isoprenylcysteine O-methyltransferase Ste14